MCTWLEAGCLTSFRAHSRLAPTWKFLLSCETPEQPRIFLLLQAPLSLHLQAPPLQRYVILVVQVLSQIKVSCLNGSVHHGLFSGSASWSAPDTNQCEQLKGER